jgi:endonuclease/exonuclease/phosphatase family metal-dependent hydrolase
MRPTRVVVTLMAAMLVAVSTPAASFAATVDATYRILTWNVAGWAMHRGSTTDGLTSAVTNAIRNQSAQFVALNELCLGQHDAIRRALRNAGWPQDPDNFARFAETNPAPCGGDGVGIALYSKAPLGEASRYTLPDDGRNEKRKLLCAPLERRPHMRFCTTHITTSNEVINGIKINKRQLDHVLARLEAFHGAGDTVVIAGDFNAQPDYGRLDGWYSASLSHANNRSNTGAYRELDDTHPGCPGYGETTTAPGNTEGPCGLGKKIDLIFARENRIVGSYSGDSLTIPSGCGGRCSDHRILTGTVTVRVTV